MTIYNIIIYNVLADVTSPMKNLNLGNKGNSKQQILRASAGSMTISDFFLKITLSI